MSINNIHLTPSMLSGFYGKDLVESGATSVPESAPPNYLGKNQKNILVIVDHSGARFLPDGELNFLTTILAACKLSMADIAIINRHHVENTALQALVNEGGKHILLFGIEPLAIGLPINFPPFQLQPFNKRTYLHAPALSEIENDKSLKTKLWTALKALFGI